MADEAKTTEEIKETDIVFDCPYCGKSLAIDYRGAGLSIPCSDCQREVEVPIPEGMELTDFDSSDEEQEIRILNLRRSLGKAEARARELEGELDSLHQANRDLEKGGELSRGKLQQILENVRDIRGHMADVTTILARITEIAENED